ncbi:hypothetical protein AB8E56_10520, partial [Francisella sp. 19X1-34]|nr:hypothetical protein [Francisella sp. 19X1-34]
MPHKYAESKGWHVPKQKYKITNWSEYNKALTNRGRIDIWLTEDAVNNWYEKDNPYKGYGQLRLFKCILLQFME